MERAALKSDGNIAAGSVLIVASALAFAMGGTAVKALAIDFNSVALLFWRNALSAVFVLAWFAVRGFPSLASQKPLTHVMRSLLTYAGLLTYFVAITSIPLANAVLMRSTNPIFVPVIALLVYHHLSDRNVWLGVIIGFVGVTCIVAPEGTSWGLSMGEVAAVFSAVFAGAAAMAIWALSASERPATQMAYFSLSSAVIAALPVPWYWQLPTLETLPNFVWMALLTTLAQVFLAAGCAIAPADKILPWSYTSVAFAVVVGFWGWGEWPSILAAIGFALVIIGAQIASRKN